MILLKKRNIAVLVLVFILFSCKKAENKEWVDLLNYTDFSNWSHFVLKPEQKGVEESEMQYPPEWLIPKVYLSDNPDSTVFSYQMHEGKKVLHISGELIGFLTSKEEYDNYHLKYKFKFGKKWQWLGDRPRDGGIFYHVVNPASDKERSPHEFNIHDGDIGSYWSFGGYGDIPSKVSTDLPESITSIIPILKPVIPSLKDTMYFFDPAGTPSTFSSSIPDMQIAVANPIADNPLGEWNELDLICLGETIIHAVNGKVVTVLYNSRYEAEGGGLVPLTKGAIKIQSEGGEQFVEYIRIKKITEIPEEFRRSLTSFETPADAAISSSSTPVEEEADTEVKWVNPEITSMPGLSHHVLQSEALGKEVGYVVWTSEYYQKERSEGYPVIYFLHGVGGTESADAASFSHWVSKAIAYGFLPPLICVFPNGGVSYYRGEVEKMIVDELVPLIDKNYNTIPRAESRALAGFSMGGEGAVYLSVMHPGLFCVTGSMGGELKLDNPQLKAAIEKAIPQWKKVNYGFYLVNGDGDQPDAFKDFANILTGEGIDHRVVILPDTDHNLGHYYERSIGGLLAFLANHIKDYN
ncbi:family 16 glycoside hydrolase [Proteiniphilum acetatigenes]|uniref:family 16 glycoside hydrolase n=1 Tax=Proteiniphilum acetatigenes TaxID=294710 RepID=UPI00036CC90D|nr:family 16 glycoside hydrolase [Proteiniphilum acetatigenes]